MASKNVMIGIDLGTSNSAAAVLRGGRPVMIPSSEGVSLGGKAFPSYVAVTADGQILVGEPAKRQATINPEGTATAFKRKMGTRERYHLRDREFSPEQLSAFLLQKIKRDAEAFVGETVDKVVVTVPAYFDDNQRNATKDACRIAGLQVERLVNEPTAAALAYGLDRLGQELRVAVIDFGGGTLDVTIMEFGKGVFEVKATSGDTHLGGSDMDDLIFNDLAERVEREHGVDIRQDRNASARLRQAAETAKIELSANLVTRLSLPYLTATNIVQGGGTPIHFEMELTRSELERMVRPVIERCRMPVRQALQDGGFTPRDIDRIVFVGGPTRMPSVRAFFEDIFGRKAEMGVDPMECVASGAAIQAGVLSGEMGEIVLVDVTPLTLGVETLGGVATPLIPRNTPIPVKKTETFTTASDLQTSVTVHVVQGERPMAADDISLGQFNLDGLAPAPRGMPKVEVTFDLDASGILNATAKDVATGKSQSIRITGSARLAEDDKKRMIHDAEQYAEQDQRRREEVQKLNEADSVAYQGERMIADYGGGPGKTAQLNSEDKSRIEAAIRGIQEARKLKDVTRAMQQAEGLKKLLQEAGSRIYSEAAQKAAAPQAAGEAGSAAASGAPGEGRVVDAEFSEKKKKAG
jgi:molecular chaperone DnaK